MALSNAIIGLIESKRNHFSVMTAQLEGASPLQSLSRGYALVTNEDGRNIKSVKKRLKQERLLRQNYQMGLLYRGLKRSTQIDAISSSFLCG